MGTPFPHEMGEGFLSGEALADPPPFERARAAVIYQGVACDMVRGLKYHDRTDLAPWMAGWMLRAGSELLAEADLIVPVPLYWRRFFRRKFNQSAELARALSARSGIRFEPSVVKRVRQTRPQVGLERREREDNLRGAFRVPPEGMLAIAGRRVLLIDDVYTTGATVRAVTLALKKGGAGQWTCSPSRVCCRAPGRMPAGGTSSPQRQSLYEFCETGRIVDQWSM